MLYFQLALRGESAPRTRSVMLALRTRAQQASSPFESDFFIFLNILNTAPRSNQRNFNGFGSFW